MKRSCISSEHKTEKVVARKDLNHMSVDQNYSSTHGFLRKRPDSFRVTIAELSHDMLLAAVVVIVAVFVFGLVVVINGIVVVNKGFLLQALTV